MADNFSLPPALLYFGIIVAIILISAVQAIPFALWSVCCYAVTKHCKSVICNCVCIACAYTCAELLSQLIKQINPLGVLGFPWVNAYVTQSGFLYGIQSASVFGAYFISFLIVLINSLLAYFIFLPRKKSLLAVAIAVFCANTIFGAFSINSDIDSSSQITALIYQDNKSSYDKWTRSSADTFEEFKNDILSQCQNQHIDIAVLSETVFTTILGEARQTAIGKELSLKLRQLAKDTSTTIACGAFSENADGQRFNSIFVFDSDGSAPEIYNKQSLVPFGEYMPTSIKAVLPMLENFNLSGKPLSYGKSNNAIDCSLGKLCAIVCFDSLFYKNTILPVKNGAQIIVLSTNDSWYNDSRAVHHHYAQAVFRAIETNRYVLRSATTGFSGIIDCHGKTVQKSQLLCKDIIIGNAKLNTDITHFTKYGYSYMYALLFLCSAYFIISYIKARKEQKHEH